MAISCGSTYYIYSVWCSLTRYIAVEDKEEELPIHRHETITPRLPLPRPPKCPWPPTENRKPENVLEKTLHSWFFYHH